MMADTSPWFSVLWIVTPLLGFLLSIRALFLTPIPRWRVALVTLLFFAALLQFGQMLQLLDILDSKLSSWEWMRSLQLFAHLLHLYCDLLQIFGFTITILHNARYSWRDQRVFYWFARIEYTSLGILALWDLLYKYLWSLRYLRRYERPSGLLAISVLMIMVHVVSTSISLAASICLKLWSNPVRRESKALNWLVASTTVLFFRSVVDEIIDMSVELAPGRPWLWIIDKLTFLTIFLADDLYLRAVALEFSPMPVWLLSEIETED